MNTSSNKGLLSNRISPNERTLLTNLLLTRLVEHRETLRTLLADIGDHDDNVYGFWHQSFKIYGRCQHMTLAIQSALESVLPERTLNEWFLHIASEGTGHEFERAHNKAWLEIPRRIVEAYFHARYFLRCAVTVAEAEYNELPMPMPSGLAALLELYRIR